MRIQNLIYALLNPVVRGLLRSPLHRIGSGSLAILCYQGRRSNRNFATPLSYVQKDDVVRFLSSRETRWWINFRDGPTPVEVEIGGNRFPGQARLLEENSAALIDGVRFFLSELPRDARVYGVGLDSERKPLEAALRQAADHLILVEVELDLTPGA